MADEDRPRTDWLAELTTALGDDAPTRTRPGDVPAPADTEGATEPSAAPRNAVLDAVLEVRGDITALAGALRADLRAKDVAIAELRQAMAQLLQRDARLERVVAQLVVMLGPEGAAAAEAAAQPDQPDARALLDSMLQAERERRAGGSGPPAGDTAR